MQATSPQYRQIGSLKVSLTGLGCNNFGWRIDEAKSSRVVAAALDAGINFFDTADLYDSGHSEEYLGRALADRRKDVVIATKFGMKLDEARPGGGRPAYLRQAAEDSLRRLGADYRGGGGWPLFGQRCRHSAACGDACVHRDHAAADCAARIGFGPSVDGWRSGVTER